LRTAGSLRGVCGADDSSGSSSSCVVKKIIRPMQGYMCKKMTHGSVRILVVVIALVRLILVGFLNKLLEVLACTSKLFILFLLVFVDLTVMQLVRATILPFQAFLNR
jgi:hypothetical protein